MPTAILIDGDFFLRRYRQIYGKKPPGTVARELHKMCLSHLVQNRQRRELYRIFFYDCPPLSKRAHSPITGRAFDFAVSATAQWRLTFHQDLRKLRKVALRMGYLNERSGHWAIHSRRLRELLAGRIGLKDLQEGDVYYDVQQKGVGHANRS